MLRLLFKTISLLSLFRAAGRGPSALARREARRRAHRLVRKTL